MSLPDHQRLIELGAELKQHCVANASPFVPKVGEPCCAMLPGETLEPIDCDTHCQLTIPALPFRIILFYLFGEELAEHNMFVRFFYFSPGDGEWYRVMVNELSEDKVSVKLVDYGYSMKLEKDHLRSITPKLLTLPFQAIRCNLAGRVRVCECEGERRGGKTD